jgi:hypothetical protein
VELDDARARVRQEVLERGQELEPRRPRKRRHGQEQRREEDAERMPGCISGPLKIFWSQPDRTSMFEWMCIPATASIVPLQLVEVVDVRSW